ncbi:MAG: hypothetical protein ACKV0T_05205 [Planctomycetales bacterium]
MLGADGTVLSILDPTKFFGPSLDRPSLRHVSTLIPNGLSFESEVELVPTSGIYGPDPRVHRQFSGSPRRDGPEQEIEYRIDLAQKTGFPAPSERVINRIRELGPAPGWMVLCELDRPEFSIRLSNARYQLLDLFVLDAPKEFENGPLFHSSIVGAIVASRDEATMMKPRSAKPGNSVIAATWPSNEGGSSPDSGGTDNHKTDPNAQPRMTLQAGAENRWEIPLPPVLEKIIRDRLRQQASEAETEPTE